MKRVVALLLICVLLTPATTRTLAAGAAEVGDLSLSVRECSPARDGRLYIYLPVYSGTADCVLTIYNAWGESVACFEREGLRANVHTFIWDMMPAEGNGAAYPADEFAPEGEYYIAAEINSPGASQTRVALFNISALAAAPAAEEGIPNLTGDAETDYMVARTLDGIILAGLNTEEKVRAVYSWIQANCLREGARDFEYFNLEALSQQIKAEGKNNELLHGAGLINFDVLDNLFVRNAKTLLIYRVGTCLEFAALFQVMLARLGIECWLIDGEFYNSDGSVLEHKWNYIRINGEYYWSDIRIDNASFERSGRTQLYYEYFLESDTQLWAQRHGWDRVLYPERSTATPAMWGDAGQNQNAYEQIVAPISEPETGSYTTMPLGDLDDKAAVVNASPVYINGVLYDFDAYTIDGYNYFKLRDLACALNGTAAQFEVSWIEELGEVWLFSGQPYTAVGGEFSKRGEGTAQASPSPCPITVNGSAVTLAAYLIGGNNYFRLRDIGIIFDFYVEWLDGAVHVDTALPYSE